MFYYKTNIYTLMNLSIIFLKNILSSVLDKWLIKPDVSTQRKKMYANDEGNSELKIPCMNHPYN